MVYSQCFIYYIAAFHSKLNVVNPGAAPLFALGLPSGTQNCLLPKNRYPIFLIVREVRNEAPI